MSDPELRQIGHLARRPQMSYVGEGDKRVALTRLDVISNQPYKIRETGESRERVTRIRWTLWREQAENAAKYLAKGAHVSLVGRLENYKIEKEGSEAKYGDNHVCTSIEYLDSKAEATARAARSAAHEEDENPPAGEAASDAPVAA
ncbi:MAG: single-strand binding protein [Gammaproteobacteria bacterium]|nr:single-strand binding protein [Gammaproteobacteria bacterium]